MRYLVAALIRLYQKVSRLTPAVCRFYPTCSCYAQTAVLRFGVFGRYVRTLRHNRKG